MTGPLAGHLPRYAPRHVLGIESSCDDTACAIVSEQRQILSHVMIGQEDLHRPYRGVVPELASRAHTAVLERVIRQALKDAKMRLCDLDALAVVAGPGLIGGLLVGLTMAKALALAAQRPLLIVNHLEAHALSVRLTQETLPFPYLLLLVSGGHSLLAAVLGVGHYVLLGQTQDDALGEAFDKAAALLGLAQAQGAALESVARQGHGEVYDLPRPLLGRAGCDFSFSGLKTALRRHVQRRTSSATLTPQDKSDLAASFQEAVCAVVHDRLLSAAKMFPRGCGPPRALVAAGGVAANTRLRQSLRTTANQLNIPLALPPPELCTDNGAMVAWAGLEQLMMKTHSENPQDKAQAFAARARWPLTEIHTP